MTLNPTSPLSLFAPPAGPALPPHGALPPGGPLAGAASRPPPVLGLPPGDAMAFSALMQAAQSPSGDDDEPEA